MRILVIGGTGKVGRPLVAALVERGVDVRVLSRSPETVEAQPGVELVAGDMSLPESLPAAFEGIDRCYLLTPLAEDEAGLGSNAVEAARRAGLERIVFQSVLRAAEAPEVPHFASKVEILDRIRETGIPWVVDIAGQLLSERRGSSGSHSRAGDLRESDRVEGSEPSRRPRRGGGRGLGASR